MRENVAPCSVATLVLACIAIAGCNTSNNSALCFETEYTLNNRVQECFPGADYIRFSTEDGVYGCESVNRVVNAEEITHQCLPWLVEASCAEIGSGDLPDFCARMGEEHFIFVQTRP